MRRLVLIFCLIGPVWAQDERPPHDPSVGDPEWSAPDQWPPVEPAAVPRQQGKLTVEFTGATAFRPARLRAGIQLQIQAIEQYGLDPASAYDAAFFLEAFYRQHGYADAVVNASIAGPWQLRMEITEGAVFHLGQVVLDGQAGLPREKLMEFLLGPLRERFPRIRQDTALPFVESDLYRGVDLIRRLYASEGFLDADVSPPDVTLQPGRTADVTVQITEGVQYRFGALTFSGDTALSEAELRSVVTAKTQGIFTEGLLGAAEGALRDTLQRRGHFHATVTAAADWEKAREGLVPVNFVIAAGPVFRFDGVTVAGTRDVRPQFIKNRLRNLRGQTYDPRKIDRGFRELLQTGLFRNLRINPEAVPGDEVRLAVDVEEAKPKELGLGVGYASFFGAIVSASYRDLNFLHTGRPLSVTVEWNQRGLNGEVVWSDPWWFESDYALRVRAYGMTSTLRGYSKHEFGVQPMISRDLTDHWTVSAFVLAKAVSVFDVDIEPAGLVGDTAYSVVSVGLTQTLDYRNNVALPTAGFHFTTTAELAPPGVGGVDFFRARGAFTYYLPITRKSTLALGARAGILFPLGDSEIPIDERFFNGGATTVRSFAELTLGPRDRQGYPLGGEAFTIFNIEYAFPIIGDLYGAVFCDAGNVVQRAEDFGLENLRYAVGAGLRYHLPIGALRLDYGLNPNPRDGEARGAVQFAVGVAF